MGIFHIASKEVSRLESGERRLFQDKDQTRNYALLLKNMYDSKTPSLPTEIQASKSTNQGHFSWGTTSCSNTHKAQQEEEEPVQGRQPLSSPSKLSSTAVQSLSFLDPGDLRDTLLPIFSSMLLPPPAFMCNLCPPGLSWRNSVLCGSFQLNKIVSSVSFGLSSSSSLAYCAQWLCTSVPASRLEA